VFAASTALLVSLILSGAWAGLNGFIYAADAGKRYRAEAAWFIFSAVLIVAAVHALLRGARPAPREDSPLTRRVLTIAFLSLLGLAVALYFPMLSIGLLSDDFVLITRAQAGVLADPAWDYLRPLPLAIWRGLSGVAGSTAAPVVLHALNIGLHGVNAWLTGILATRFGFSQRSAFVAAIAFLVLPSSVEAVAWASGVFDVLLVTLTIAACLALTTIAEWSEDNPRPAADRGRAHDEGNGCRPSSAARRCGVLFAADESSRGSHADRSVGKSCRSLCVDSHDRGVRCGATVGQFVGLCTEGDREPPLRHTRIALPR